MVLYSVSQIDRQTDGLVNRQIIHCCAAAYKSCYPSLPFPSPPSLLSNCIMLYCLQQRKGEIERKRNRDRVKEMKGERMMYTQAKAAIRFRERWERAGREEKRERERMESVSLQRKIEKKMLAKSIILDKIIHSI